MMVNTLQHSEIDFTESGGESFEIRRFTLEEFHRLIDLGMFDDERVELLDGWIVSKMTKNPPHEATVARIMETLRPLLPATAGLRIQSAITIGPDEPEPDLAVVKGPGSSYVHSHPGIGEIDLVIEVADSSIRKDRRKAAIYSIAQIPNYWIVNLPDDCVEVFQHPESANACYSVSNLFRRGESIEVALQCVSVIVPVSNLLLDSPLSPQDLNP